jgi:hypothetical protein
MTPFHRKPRNLNAVQHVVSPLLFRRKPPSVYKLTHPDRRNSEDYSGFRCCYQCHFEKGNN